MELNQICKKLNEESHFRASIPEDKRYSPHFEYKDLVIRLNKLKKDMKIKSSTLNPKVNYIQVPKLPDLSEKLKKSISISKNPSKTHRIQRQNTNKLLSELKYNNSTIKSTKLITKSENYIKILNLIPDFKSLPILKKPHIN